MKSIPLLILFLVITHISTHAQYTKEDEKPKNDNSLSDVPFKDRLYTGGNIGFGIYGNILYLDVSPIIGYKLNKKLSTGVGLRYSLIRNMLNKVNLTSYGGSVFARYKVIPQAFIHAELEGLRTYNFNPSSIRYLERDMAYMGFIGAGYTFGEGISFSVLVLYDLIDHVNSPYRNAYLLGPSGPPVILRGGITIGF
jgi:hypothetical protein